jgi:hypothetical protein
MNHQLDILQLNDSRAFSDLSLERLIVYFFCLLAEMDGYLVFILNEFQPWGKSFELVKIKLVVKILFG